LINSERDYSNIQNTCNAYNAYNAYNDKMEKRLNHCIRLKPSIHRAVKNYCHDTRMNIGRFYEEAAITFFQINPPPETGSLIMVVKEDEIHKNNSLEQSLSEIICIGDLEEWLDSVRPLKHQGIELHKSKIKTLRDIIRECKKLNTRSDKLEQLLEEALDYVL